METTRTVTFWSAAVAGETTVTAARPAVINETAHTFNLRILGNPLCFGSGFDLRSTASVTVLASMQKTHLWRQSEKAHSFRLRVRYRPFPRH
jgi:hypothetical protein